MMKLSIIYALLFMIIVQVAADEDDASSSPSYAPTTNVPKPKPKPKPVTPSLPSSLPSTSGTFETMLFATDGVSYSHFGRQVSASGNMAMVGTDLSGIESAVYLYCQPVNSSDWIYVTKLSTESMTNGEYDGFGLTMAMDSGLMMIGAKYDSNSGSAAAGQVYAFSYTNTDTCEISAQYSLNNAQTLFPMQSAAPKTYFGSSIAVYGTVAAVGAPGFSSFDAEGGAVFLYTYDSLSQSWVFHKIVSGSGGSYATFGTSVSLYKNVLAVGASGDSSRASIGGSVSVYQIVLESNQYDDFSQVSSKIETIATLYPSQLNAHGYFGRSVLFREHVGMVSAYDADGSGVVYVFEADGSYDAEGSTYLTWKETTKFKALDSHSFDNFGQATAFATSDDSASTILMVGAGGDSIRGSMAGAIYTFGRSQSKEWSSLGKMYSNSTRAHDNYGCSISVLNNNILVGADLADGYTSRSGAVYIESNVVPYFESLQHTIDEKGDSDSKDGGSGSNRSSSASKIVVALVASILPAIALTALVTYRAVKLRARSAGHPTVPELLPTRNPLSSRRSSRAGSRDRPFSLVVEDTVEEDAHGILPDLRNQRETNNYSMAAMNETQALRDEGALPIHISV